MFFFNRRIRHRSLAVSNLSLTVSIRVVSIDQMLFGNLEAIRSEKRDRASRDAAAHGDTELPQHLGSLAAAIKRVRAEVEPVAVAQMRNRPTAEVAAFFEESDGAAAARKIDRRGQSRDPSTDDTTLLAKLQRDRNAP
jgi:hypothetical protein